MTPLALGIDVGTSGVRASLIDLGRCAVAAGAATMAEAGTDPRAPQTWAKALDLALGRLAEVADLSRVGGVAVDGTSGTVLGLDRAGDTVGTALMYNDATQDAGILDRVNAAAPETSAARGASALARAIEISRRSGVTRIVHQADWVAGLLTQDPVPTDESNGLKTGYDPVTRAWPGWIADAGLEPALLPEVVPVGARSGSTKAAFGLPQGLPVVAGLTDGCASFLATGARQSGDGVSALGSTLTIKLLSDQPIFAPEFGIYSHRIGDMWLAGGASNTGGAVLASVFDAKTLAALSERIDPEMDSGRDYYPLLRPGERFPINDTTYQPRMTPRPEDDGAYLHGLLEGIARIEALGYRRLQDLGAPAVATLYSVGGGARNEIWTRMRSRIVGAPTARAASTEASEGTATLVLPHLQ